MDEGEEHCSMVDEGEVERICFGSGISLGETEREIGEAVPRVFGAHVGLPSLCDSRLQVSVNSIIVR